MALEVSLEYWITRVVIHKVFVWKEFGFLAIFIVMHNLIVHVVAGSFDFVR
jgi:hypothetical protein